MFSRDIDHLQIIIYVPWMGYWVLFTDEKQSSRVIPHDEWDEWGQCAGRIRYPREEIIGR